MILLFFQILSIQSINSYMEIFAIFYTLLDHIFSLIVYLLSMIFPMAFRQAYIEGWRQHKNNDISVQFCV